MTLEVTAFNVANQLGRVNVDQTEIVDLEDPIKTEIRNAITYYNRLPSHLTELRGGTLNTQAGVYWYNTVTVEDAEGFQVRASPRQIRTNLSVQNIVTLHYMRENPGRSGLNEPLEEIAYRHFERLFEGSVPQGQPELYTKYAGSIGIWPTPSEEYPLYWSGVVRPVVPQQDTDDSVWFRHNREMIETRAAAAICAKYLRNNEWAQSFKSLENDLYQNFMSERSAQTSAKRLRPHM